MSRLQSMRMIIMAKRLFKVHDYLIGGGTTDKEYDMCMAGFILKNTLSDNGAVTRGVCVVDEK